MVMRCHDAPQGTASALLDLGFDHGEGLSATAALALSLNGLIDQHGLVQTEAAHVMGIADGARYLRYSCATLHHRLARRGVNGNALLLI